MAKEAMKIFLLATAIAAASFWIPAAGQSGCTTALIGLSPCLNYISGSSSTPSSSCCSQLGSIVQSQPQCLCMVVNGGGSILGISINKTQALALPSACRVQTPPASACNAVAGGSSGSPPVSPQAAPSAPTAPSAPATPSAPSAPSTPTTTPEAPSSPTDTPSTLAPTSSSSGNGSKSSNGDSSDGKMNKSLMSVVFAALILAHLCGASSE